jgi:FkbM family methyltransferase
VTSTTVVIPVHNGAATLGQQLRALAGQVGAPEFDVVVVLNSCTDESRAVAERAARGMALSVIEANATPSAAYARNAGAARSSSEFLLFCDSDDRVGDRWVGEMLGPLVAGSADIVGGCPVVARTDLPAWMYEHFYAWVDGPHLLGWQGKLYPLGASIGCTRTAFDAVGGFDESFADVGCEEMDLAFRMVRSGARMGIAPAATFSYRPVTSLLGQVRRQRGFARGRAYLELKEGGLSVPSVRHEIRALARTAGGLLVRDREWRPAAYVAALATEIFWFDARRRTTRRQRHRPIEAPDVNDFVAPVATPLIGGLAFQARVRQIRHAATLIERHSLEALARLVRDGDVFVDCGANVGTFTVAAGLAVGPTGRVYAFEPDPRTRSYLERNVRRHGVDDRVVISDAALGSTSGPMSFTQYDNDVVSSFVEAPSAFSPGAAVGRIDVDVVTLDAVGPSHVDFVKIDVEGYEFEVLRGAQRLLARCPDAILMFEINPATLERAGHAPGEVFDLFASDRWALWLIDEHTADAPAPIRALNAETRALVDSAERRWYGNVLAVPQHRRIEISGVIEGIGDRLDQGG